MTPERVLQHPPLVLDQRQRERYFEDGFLTVPGYVGAAWLDRLRAVVAAKIEESRMLTASDDQFDLAPDHSAEKPKHPPAAQGRRRRRRALAPGHPGVASHQLRRPHVRRVSRRHRPRAGTADSAAG